MVAFLKVVESLAAARISLPFADCDSNRLSNLTQMRFTTRTLLAVTAALAICCALAILAWSSINHHAADLHQRSVTRELIEWGNEYAQIDDDASAIRAAEMISYIGTYYVPRDGYRDSDETKRELEVARVTSLGKLIDALERYTGHQFGDDHSAWSQWAESQNRLRGEP